MLRKYLRDLVNLLYPNTCVACERELVEGESQICTFCRWEMPFTDYHHNAENYVTELFAGRIPFQNACALFYFKGGQDRYRHMIHSMKYQSRRDVAYLLGEIFGSVLRESDLYKDVNILIPIPLHWTRRIKRGYNQSEYICRGMSVAMGIPCNAKAVRRNRITRQQARKKRIQRWDNVSGAFTVVDKSAFEGQHFLLVDDVLTTGSTVEACITEIIGKVPDTQASIAALAIAKHTGHNLSK